MSTSDNTKDITERVEDVEKKIDIIMSMLKHINSMLTDKVIDNIEFDIEEAVKNRLNQHD